MLLFSQEKHIPILISYRCKILSTDTEGGDDASPQIIYSLFAVISCNFKRVIYQYRDKPNKIYPPVYSGKGKRVKLFLEITFYIINATP